VRGIAAGPVPIEMDETDAAPSAAVVSRPRRWSRGTTGVARPSRPPTPSRCSASADRGSARPIARRQPARFRVLAPSRRWCRLGQHVPFMGYSILTAEGAVLPPRFATRQDAFVYLALASAVWTRPDVEQWALVDADEPAGELVLPPGEFAAAAGAWLEQRAAARAAAAAASRPRRPNRPRRKGTPPPAP